MRLAEGKFLTDENIDSLVVEFLRAQGHDVFDVKEEGLIGSDDLTLLRLALALTPPFIIVGVRSGSEVRVRVCQFSGGDTSAS